MCYHASCHDMSQFDRFLDTLTMLQQTNFSVILTVIGAMMIEKSSTMMTVKNKMTFETLKKTPS